MRRFVTVAVSLLVVSLAVAGTAWVAPRWTKSVGLDFWNLGAEKSRLETALAEQEDWDSAGEEVRRRGEVVDGIAANWCDGRLTLPEAVDAVSAVVRTSPDWFDQARFYYEARGLPPTATDRDVVTWYLRVKLESMLARVEHTGDLSRAAVLAARLAQFDAEVRG